MKLSASIYSSKEKNLVDLLRELDELAIDFLHVDCFDKDFDKVAADLEIIRQYSKTPIDFHAITTHTARYIALAEKYKIEKLTFQLENLQEDFPVLNQRKFDLGLAIVSETPIETLNTYVNNIDFILLMTTEPGVSGSVFQRKNFLRIRKSHQLFPALKIHVDGGVNDQIAFILRMLGVYAAVSGSYLVNHLPISAALIPLRFGHTSSTILVKEIAIAKEDLPILPLENTSLKQIISKLDEYKMGFVFFEKDEKLAGICSNADLRKGLLKCAKQQQYIDFDMSNILDFVNIKPFVMYENASIKEMLEQIKAQAFPILFLPVVNDNQLLTGALTFNELIKGEE